MKNSQWYRIQRTAALIFAVFLSVHLLNALLLLGGDGAFESFLNAVRPLYQNIVVETVLVASVLTHVVASLVLWKRRPVDARRSLGQQLQTWAGFIVLAFIPGHVAFLRVFPYLYDFEPDFDFLWMSTEIWPTLFVPYYAVFGTAASFHLAWGALLFFKKKRESTLHYVAFSVLGVLFFAMSIRVAVAERRPSMTPAKVEKYLTPYREYTPWLVEMADRHPFIRPERAEP